MARCEVTVWKRGNKYGVTKLFSSCEKARNYVKKEKKKPRYIQSSMLRIRPEFYRGRMKRKF